MGCFCAFPCGLKLEAQRDHSQAACLMAFQSLSMDSHCRPGEEHTWAPADVNGVENGDGQLSARAPRRWANEYFGTPKICREMIRFFLLVPLTIREHDGHFKMPDAHVLVAARRQHVV